MTALILNTAGAVINLVSYRSNGTFLLSQSTIVRKRIFRIKRKAQKWRDTVISELFLVTRTGIEPMITP